jgi:PAS domain S-box-containing protein
VPTSALRESQARLELATEAAGIGVWDWEIASGKMSYSPRAKAICGFGIDQQITFDDARGVTHPEDYPRTSAMAQRALDPQVRERAPYQYRVVRPDGDVRWVLAQGEAIFAETDGVERAVRYVGTLQDVTERVRLEQAEQMAKARLSLALSAAQMAVWELDVASGDLSRSIELNRLFGFPDEAHPTAEEIRARNYPGETERIGELWRQAAARGDRHFEAEYRYCWTDGSVRWHWLRVEALPDEAGQPVRAVGVIMDVTDRKAADSTLLLSEQSLRLATEAAEVGTWDLDLTTDTLTWSDRTKAAFGISPGVPCSMADFYGGLHPDDLAVTTEAFLSATDPDRRADYEVEYRTIGKEDRVVRWVAAKGRGIFDSDGRCVRAIGTAIDITRRREIDDRLRRSEAELSELNKSLERQVAERTGERNLLATIVETTDAFIQVADLDYRFLAINRASADEFERVFGVRPAVGDSMLDLLADRTDDQTAVKALWSRALAGEEFTVVEEFGDPARARPCYEINFNTLRGSDGKRIGAFQIVYDVTERLRDQAKLAEAQDALRQSQKLEAIGQLTGGVAHDFNNLLTPIIGGLDILQRRATLDERTGRILSGALLAAERAKTLVQRLLAFSRRQPLQATSVDVAGLINSMAELVASTTGPQIKVTTAAAAGLPAAHADHNQLEMAILNLAVNARDAMPDGGTLRISAQHEKVGRGHRSALAPGGYVRLSVADTGVGMDEETRRRAAEPFFSTKGIGKGTGLGLSMVHGLASQLGGALYIHSRPGLGTNIDLWLPISHGAASPAYSAAGQSANATPPKRKGAALLVDDEDVVREATARMLEELGYEVVEASSGEAALKAMNDGVKFDILVTDHLMPGLSGVDLARTVRSRRQVPVLIVSGYAEAEGIAPDLPRLTKPFRQADLAAALLAADGRS